MTLFTRAQIESIQVGKTKIAAGFGGRYGDQRIAGRACLSGTQRPKCLGQRLASEPEAHSLSQERAMPIVEIYGQRCRVRPMLDAIGAQEALEAHGARRLAKVMQSRSQEREMAREQHQLAGRRNAAEKRLRVGERAAWNFWRQCSAAGRAAAYAVLTDLPTAKEKASCPVHS